ncbi:unnamed protein product [Peronospora destructor]|uniref:Uncharacterized protein n=1 Tax=Peronospora destructor TaxID=86335 RepID=A0AAV0VDX9_9STRA|nr:unnamed protein product [Peronospora destructor]
MRSLVTPSTLIVRISGASESKLHRYQSLEFDNLEGEQSTCSLCLNGQEPRYRGLLRTLFPDVTNSTGVIAILQGDLDGSVRFSLVSYPCQIGDVTKVSVIRSGTLVQLDEPVQMVVPFNSFNPMTPSSEENAATGLPAVFNALLLVGTRGRIGVIHSKNGCSIETLPVSLKKLELGYAVQSLAFVDSLKVFVFCSNGSAFVFRGNDVIRKAQLGDSEVRGNGGKICAEKMHFQPGILRLVMHDSTHDMSILFVSGRATTISETLLRAKIASVLLHEQQNHQKEQSCAELPTSESHVRNLLHRIAQTSIESTALRTQSKQIDRQFKMLHSALELLQIVETQGIESVIACKLRASMVTTGTYSDRPTIKLVCSIRFVHPGVIVSLEEWWLCMHVRTRECSVMTHSFLLNNVLARGEQSIILDPDTLALESLWVSCSMLFCPIGNEHPDKMHSKPNCVEFKPISQNDMLPLAIPLVQNRRFLLAQLSQPVEEETPVSQVAIHSAFRQNHEPFMPVERKTDGEKASSSALWSGVQWWTALADHAHKNASFATLWAKIAPPGAIPLALSPPSRFVISIPSFFDAEGEDENDEDDDEDLEKIRAERMVSFLCHLLELHTDDVPRLRRSCRTQHGKLWTALRSMSGGLILLRFTPSEDHHQSVDLSIQCSDIADLSVMRALILETINKQSDEAARETSKDDESEELVLGMSEMLEPIAALDKLLEELTQKTANSVMDPQSSICTDEVLYALSQLAHLETQTLTLYWKTRSLLNRNTSCRKCCS